MTSDDGRSDEVALLLARLAAAWGRRDIDGVLETMTDDCVYQASIGAAPGATWVGKIEIRSGLSVMFASDEGAVCETGEALVTGSRAAWEWIYRFPNEPGRPLERGCDFFDVRNGLICRKAGYRKRFG